LRPQRRGRLLALQPGPPVQEESGGVKDERKRELERQYQRDRAAILGDESMSWEKEMRAILELFNRYRVRQENGGEEG
jgi:hypothetical protein